MERVGTLVIGASQAGLQLATSLRDLGATGGITLIGRESRAPYQRPAAVEGLPPGQAAGGRTGAAGA